MYLRIQFSSPPLSLRSRRCFRLRLTSARQAALARQVGATSCKISKNGRRSASHFYNTTFGRECKCKILAPLPNHERTGWDVTEMARSNTEDVSGEGAGNDTRGAYAPQKSLRIGDPLLFYMLFIDMAVWGTQLQEAFGTVL